MLRFAPHNNSMEQKFFLHNHLRRYAEKILLISRPFALRKNPEKRLDYYSIWLYYNLMEYNVRIKKKVARGLKNLPKDVQKLLFLLIEDLKSYGPIQKSWQNFSPLGKDQYHCHLTYRYVACWTCHKGEIEIEVYYVGSREKAPY